MPSRARRTRVSDADGSGGGVKRISARRRHPVAGLLVVALGLVLLGGLYAAAFSPSSARAAGEGYTAEQVAQGKALFVNNCASCHGVNGAGQEYAKGTIIGPSLVGVGAASVDFQVMTGRMPAANQGPQVVKHRVQYSQEESNLLAAYVDSLGPGPAIPARAQYDPAGLTKSEVARGGELFRTNCAQCHGAAAGGGALTGGKYAPRIEVGPRYVYDAMLTGPQNMPVFSDSTLSPQDKKQLIGYIEALKSTPNQGGSGLGRLGTVTEGLAGWVVGIGALIAVAIWLGIKGVRV